MILLEHPKKSWPVDSKSLLELFKEITINWLVVWTPLKNMKVSWDDDIPNINGKIIQSCSSHHQPDQSSTEFSTSLSQNLPKHHCHGGHCCDDQKDDDETQEPRGAQAAIYEAYLSGLWFKGYPSKIWPEICYSTYIWLCSRRTVVYKSTSIWLRG